MADSEHAQDLLKLIVEEVDEARDIYRLAEQLAPLLPIRSFDDLVKAADGRPMQFRDAKFDVESLREYIPRIAFPVQDLRGLIERLGHIVRLAPPHLGVDVSTPDGARRQSRYSGMLGPGLESSQGRRMEIGTTIPHGKPPQGSVCKDY